MRLFIDIETIPSQDESVKSDIAEGISPPGNISKAETIEKWEKEKKPKAIDEEWRKTGLNATKGELLCMSYAIDDDPAKCLWRVVSTSESELLHKINDELSEAIGLRKPLWVAHYGSGFDFRFLFLRFVINGIRPKFKIPHDAKPWDDCIFDTCTQWKGTSKSSTSGSLDAISKALGHEGKGDFDGSKVWGAVQAGEYDKIWEYCNDDVEKTRVVFKALNFE